MKNKNLKYALHFLFNLSKTNSNKHRISNMSIKFILEHDQIIRTLEFLLLLIGNREFKKVLSVFTTAAANKNFKEQIMLRERENK